MTAHSSPVWLISGCSTGFGRELAQQTIARGFKVVVTARDTSSIADLVEGHDNALAVALDVTHQASIDQAVKAALDTFGTIDVLVNTPVTAIRARWKRVWKAKSARSLMPTFLACLP